MLEKNEIRLKKKQSRGQIDQTAAAQQLCNTQILNQTNPNCKNYWKQ